MLSPIILMIVLYSCILFPIVGCKVLHQPRVEQKVIALVEADFPLAEVEAVPSVAEAEAEVSDKKRFPFFIL